VVGWCVRDKREVWINPKRCSEWTNFRRKIKDATTVMRSAAELQISMNLVRYFKVVTASVMTVFIYDLRLHKISPVRAYIWKFHGVACPRHPSLLSYFSKHVPLFYTHL